MLGFKFDSHYWKQGKKKLSKICQHRKYFISFFLNALVMFHFWSLNDCYGKFHIWKPMEEENEMEQAKFFAHFELIEIDFVWKHN